MHVLWMEWKTWRKKNLLILHKMHKYCFISSQFGCLIEQAVGYFHEDKPQISSNTQGTLKIQAVLSSEWMRCKVEAVTR